MALHDFVNAETCKRLSPLRLKQRQRILCPMHAFKLLQQFGGFWPDRGHPPFVTLAVQPNATCAVEIDVSYAQIGNLLDTCARVEQERKDRTVP
jgi:hypothetical protein